MNKRILKLVNEAGFHQPEMERLGIEDKFQKFAELIVEECMWKIMQRKEEAIDNEWHVDEAMSAALSDISEHFGVEE